MSCFRNTLVAPGTPQQAVKAELDLLEIAKTNDAARHVVSHFRHSAAANCALKKTSGTAEQNNCATSWISTFITLEELYEQQIPVQTLVADETITEAKL